MAVLYEQGKITKRTLDDFTRGVKVSELPEHVKPKAKSKKS